MADELDGCGHKGCGPKREGGLGVYSSVPYEFAITLSCYNVVDTFFPCALKVCDTPFLGVLKNVFTSAGS